MFNSTHPQLMQPNSDSANGPHKQHNSDGTMNALKNVRATHDFHALDDPVSEHHSAQKAAAQSWRCEQQLGRPQAKGGATAQMLDFEISDRTLVSDSPQTTTEHKPQSESLPNLPASKSCGVRMRSRVILESSQKCF